MANPLQLLGQAHVAPLAVEEAVAAADPADAAAVAVVLLLVLVVKQVADQAGVLWDGKHWVIRELIIVMTQE